MGCGPAGGGAGAAALALPRGILGDLQLRALRRQGGTCAPDHSPACSLPPLPQYLSPAAYQPQGEEDKQRRKAAAERRQQQVEQRQQQGDQSQQQQKAGRQARQAAAAKRPVRVGEGAARCAGGSVSSCGQCTWVNSS